jgi:hypothetical protein
MIAILCSTFREGPPFLSTLRSAIAARPDFVLVCEAAVGDNPPAGDETELPAVGELPNDPLVEIWRPRGPFADDADKRSSMLRSAKTRANALGKPKDEPLWILWLDGDELLVYPETFADLCYAASHTEGFAAGGGGFPFRIVELDGSVALTYGKVIRAEIITRYVVSSYQVELANGMVVALPNVKVCAAGGIPAMSPEDMAELGSRQDELMAIHRPPVAGESHILHRSILRHPDRIARVERQNEAEGRWFSEILGPDGTVLKEVPR